MKIAGSVPEKIDLKPDEWSPEEQELVLAVIDIARRPKTATDA